MFKTIHSGFHIFKRLLAWCLLAGLMAAGLAAQNFADPRDAVYDDLDNWSSRRLVGNLPDQRPYSLQTIKPLLEVVLEHPAATAVDRRRAGDYLRRIDDGFHAGVQGRLRTSDGAAGPYWHANAEFEMAGLPTEWLGAVFDFQVYLLDRSNGTQESDYTGQAEDYLEDWASMGESGVLIRQMAHTYVAVGEMGGSLQGYLGYGRQSVGDFSKNGIVIGSQGSSSGRLSFQLDLPEFTFAYGLYELVATADADTPAAQPSSGKHVFYHSLDAHVAPWLDLGLYESVVTGPYVDPLYFIPLSVFFQLQGAGGFEDGNSLIGLDFKLKPFEGFDVKGTVYVDDLHWNDIVSFDWDTKWKLAFQTGLSWSPAMKEVSDWLRRLDFDYTAVMPYMYTHYDGGNGGSANFTDYTNRGANFGPDLQPNSGRWSLAGSFSLLDDPLWGRLNADLGLVLVSHGNASADITSGNGTITDPGYLDGQPTFQPPFVDPTGQPYTRFLTQDVLEHVFQTRLGLSYTLSHGQTKDQVKDRAWGSTSLDLGYTYEHVWNAGLVEGAEADHHYLSLGVSWLY